MKTNLVILTCHLLAQAATAVTFETWVASYGLTGGDAAESADPDNDRLSNLLEYALHGGVPNVHGPYTNQPTIGWSIATATGYSLPFTGVPSGAPIGTHLALNYKLRSGIEDVSAAAEISMPCPASNVDGSLMRWVGGQSIISVRDGLDGGTVAVCRLRADLLERGFMRLNVTRGTGLTLPPVDGTAQATLQLDIGGAAHVNRTVGSATTTTPTVQDISYMQVSSPEVVTDVSWPWALGSSGYTSEQVTRSSTNLSVLAPTVGNTQLWTYVGAGSTKLQIITPARTYERLMNTFSQSSVISRTQGTSTTGSLRRHMDTQVDARIASFTSYAERAEMFSDRNPVTPAYTRNVNCWLSTVDLTPIAAWNSDSNFQKGPTLISPRHVVGANHYQWAVGTTVHFVEADNDVVVRTITAVASIAGTDIILGVLNSDVPAGISFARVLPADWATKLPTLSTFGVPVCSADQGKRVFLRNVRAIGTSVSCEPPNIASRIGFYKDAVSGDSGSPCFAVIGGEMVLLCTWLGGGGGTGPSLVNYTTQINAAMTTLGGGGSLTAVDLSTYTTF